MVNKAMRDDSFGVGSEDSSKTFERERIFNEGVISSSRW